MKGLFKSRRFRQGSMATAITAVVVALVVVINLVATTLTDRYSLTLDLTPSKLFSITAETKAYLADLPKDVVIYVLDSETSFTNKGEYYLQSAEVLKKYALESSRVRLEFVDLVANPAFAQNYPEFQLSSSSILVTCGEKVRDLSPSELYDVQQDMYGQYYPIASKAEQVLTSAILSVTSDVTVNVAIVTGHNEEDISPFISLLSSNNYLTGTVDLAIGAIDPVYDVAIIAAPQRDFSEDELRMLDAFLQNDGQYGKTLLYFAPIQQTDTPNLSAFLADWGVGVGTGLIQETDSTRVYSFYGVPDPYIAALYYAEDYYSTQARAANKPSVAAYGRPLEILFDSKSNIATSTLLEYAETACVAVSQDEIYPPDGPIPYLTMSKHSTFSGATPLESQVVVCASSAFIDTTFLNNPNFANSDYLLGLLADLTEREDSIRIQSKELGGSTLDINLFQAMVLGAVLAVLFPLTVLISGIVIWARRRHR